MPITPFLPISQPSPPLQCERFSLELTPPRRDLWQASRSTRLPMRVAPPLVEPQEVHVADKKLGQGSKLLNPVRQKGDTFRLMQCQRGSSKHVLTASLESAHAPRPGADRVISTRLPAPQIQKTWKVLQNSKQWQSRLYSGAAHQPPNAAEQLAELVRLGHEILSESHTIDWHEPAYHAKLVVFRPSGKTGSPSTQVLQEIRKPFHYNGVGEDLIPVFLTGQLNEETLWHYASGRIGSFTSQLGHSINPVHWRNPLTPPQAGHGADAPTLRLSSEAFEAMQRTAQQYGYHLDQPEQQARYVHDLFQMMQTIAESLEKTPGARLGMKDHAVGGAEPVHDLVLPEREDWA